MTIKTDISRFDIHDELTAPGDSARMLASAASVGEITKFVGVLAESPAALRAFVRMRAELVTGELPGRSAARIALAVAERRGDTHSVAQHASAARAAGLGLDEISLARGFESRDEREQALLTLLEAVFDSDGHVPQHLVEEAREADWTDAQILEALAQMALAEFQSLIANAAALPRDQADSEILPAAA